jgi:hypothetical protein
MMDLKRNTLKLQEQRREEERCIEEVKRAEAYKNSPLFSNWRNDVEVLKELNWSPTSGNGPTNSASQTFSYFQQNFETGQPNTMNASVIGGDQEAPNIVTVDLGFGEVGNVEGPSPSQYALQGYAPLLTPEYKDAEKKYLKELEEYRKKEDENLKKIKSTLKSFGTSWGEMRSSRKWVKQLSDGSIVAVLPTGNQPSVMNWTNNVAVIKLRQAPDADPMFIDYNPQDGINDWVVINAEIQRQVLHEIGEPPVEPKKENYLVSRRTDFKDANPQLDASQEFAQNIDADYMMNARVQDLTPLSRNPYGIDYGEIASTDLKGILKNPYSDIKRGELSELRWKLAKRYMNPFSNSMERFTEKDLTSQEIELLRRNIQQLLDFKYSSREDTAKGGAIKTQIRPSQRQIKTYGMERGDKMYSLNAYLANTTVNHKIENNDLETLMGTSIAITDRRGRLKGVIDDFDFQYGYERGDSGLPGTPILQKSPGDQGLGYIEKNNTNLATDNDFTSTRQSPNTNIARTAIYGARVVGQGNPVPVFINFNRNKKRRKKRRVNESTWSRISKYRS